MLINQRLFWGTNKPMENKKRRASHDDLLGKLNILLSYNI